MMKVITNILIHACVIKQTTIKHQELIGQISKSGFILLSVVVMKHRAFLGGKALFPFWARVFHEGKPRQKVMSLELLKQRPQRNVYCLVSRFTFSYVSYITQSHLPKDVTTRNHLHPPSISIQEKVPQTYSHTNWMKAICLLSISSPRHLQFTSSQ